MPFAYYDRLSPARRRIYRRSDAIEALGLPPELEVGHIVSAISTALGREDRAAVQKACQALVDALAQGYRVPPVRVRVLARRPTDDRGELHGLYEPGDIAQEHAAPSDDPALRRIATQRHGRRRARITVWMRTAKRRQVVAFKSFLRTLVHELAHHLDYELFMLEETFHTEGFYKRESSLSNALLDQASRVAPVDRPSDRPGFT